MSKQHLVILGLLILAFAAAQAVGGPEEDPAPEAKPPAEGKAADPAVAEEEGPPRLYVGEKTCKKCHFKQHKTWRKMKHAQAWENLPEEYRKPDAKDEAGRACISCHVTGFGAAEQKGFVDAEASKHLLGVQCEACHGPGSLHIEAAKKLKAVKVEGKRVKKFAEGQDPLIDTQGKDCRTCHNPHINYAKKYGPKEESK